MRHRLLTACRPSASDAHLASRAADGDDDAFEKLYARYQPRLEAYCRSIVRHDEDARDAVQNAMTKALVALRRDSGPTNVQGWLFRIAHNEAISLLRRRRPTTELPEVVHDHALGPAGDLLLREELRATLDDVRELPGNLRHPLLLRELAGLSYMQVAEVVGGTPAAARKAVFAARTALSADRAGRDEACAVIRQSLSEGDGRRRRARTVRSHLQSCDACCAWESEQRLRRHQLASPLPAAGSAGGFFAGVLGLFGGGSTVAAGVSGGLATNAKIAASLAVIAAGATPVVTQVERAAPSRASRATAGVGVASSSSSPQPAAVPGSASAAPALATAAAARVAAQAAARVAATTERRLADRRAADRAEQADDGARMATSARPAARRADRRAPTAGRATADGRARVSGADPSAPRSSTADGTERVALDAFAAGAIPRRSRMQSGADASPRPADPLALQPAAGTPDAAAGTTGAQPGDTSEDRFGGVG